MVNSDKYTTEELMEKLKEEKVIAIIDSGVDYWHSDLESRMWINPYPSEKDPEEDTKWQSATLNENINSSQKPKEDNKEYTKRNNGR